MNIVLLHPQDWVADAVAVVRDHRAVHIREVLRSQVGDSLRMCADAPIAVPASDRPAHRQRCSGTDVGRQHLCSLSLQSP